MMRLIDVPQFLAWLIGGREKNNLDMRVLDYPTLRVYPSEHAYLPVHSGLILESLALDPDATPSQKLTSVVSLVNQVCEEAKHAGIREAFYISSDERTDESAVRQLGFEKVVCYRKKL